MFTGQNLQSQSQKYIIIPNRLKETKMPTNSIYNFEFKTIGGANKSLTEYKDKVLLIVNTASKCGFTSQYKGLEELYLKHKEQGLVIIGFPCNQFAGQEAGDENEIKNFCSLNYNITFPLSVKIEVNGDNAHPIFKFLKKECKGVLGTEYIKWNFTKFLVNKNGEVIKRFAPNDKPEKIGKYIESLFN